MSEQQQIESESVTVRRELESGEVFEASGPTREQALEVLADKMADAKLHATKKIREQQQEIKDWRSRNERATLTNDAVSKFVSEHDDYLNDGDAGDKNGELMRMKLAELGLSVTPENLETAFLHLTKRGFLQLKGEEAQRQPTTGKTKEPVQWITEPSRVEPTRTQIRRHSTIGTHSRIGSVPYKNEYSLEELEKMPREKITELANLQLSGAIPAPSWARPYRRVLEE